VGLWVLAGSRRVRLEVLHTVPVAGLHTGQAAGRRTALVEVLHTVPVGVLEGRRTGQEEDPGVRRGAHHMAAGDQALRTDPEVVLEVARHNDLVEEVDRILAEELDLPSVMSFSLAIEDFVTHEERRTVQVAVGRSPAELELMSTGSPSPISGANHLRGGAP